MPTNVIAVYCQSKGNTQMQAVGKVENSSMFLWFILRLCLYPSGTHRLLVYADDVNIWGEAYLL
jgi:hypothetical protein